MKKVIIADTKKDISVKGGLSLAQLAEISDAAAELLGWASPRKGETMRGFVRDAHEAWLRAKVAEELGLGDDWAEWGGYDAASRRLRLRTNEIRNSDLSIWHGGWQELPMETADTVWGRCRRAVGFVKYLEANKGRLPALWAYIRESLRHRPDAANSNAASRWPSWYGLVKATGCWNPSKLERAIWAAREAYGRKWPSQNGRVSTGVLARAIYIVGSVKAPGKVAIVARAIQLGWDFPGAHKSAREFLVRALLAEAAVARGEEPPVTEVEPAYARGLIGWRMVKEGWAWRMLRVYKPSTSDEWVDYEWGSAVPLIDKIPTTATPAEEKLILDALDRLLVFKNGIVDVATTVRNIRQWQKAEWETMEDVLLRILKKHKVENYLVYWGWEWESRKPLPSVVAVVELSSGELYLTGGSSLKDAIKDASEAFARRRTARATDEQVAAAVDPDKGVLICLEDSFRAGNCRPGTMAWLKKVGLYGRKVAPLWLVHQKAKETGERLAMNAVKLVAVELAVA